MCYCEGDNERGNRCSSGNSREDSLGGTASTGSEEREGARTNETEEGIENTGRPLTQEGKSQNLPPRHSVV